MSGQVFISHSNADRERVEYVRRLVEAQGLGAYLAEHDPQPGHHLPDKVETRIRSCDAMVVLLTTASIDSRYVHQEIGAARMAGKLIVPLVHPDLRGEALAMLDGAEYLTFDADDPCESTPDLVGELRKIADRSQLKDAVLAVLVAALVVGAIFVSVQMYRSGAEDGAPAE